MPAWTAAPHRPLALVTDGLWQVEAEMATPPFRRRMTLIRLGSGELVVHSAIACDEATMAQIDELGRIATIVVPSRYHRMDAPAYAARYPAARVVAPVGSAEAVRKVVRVDGGLDLLPSDPSLRWEPIAGGPMEAVLIHTDRAGAITLVFNDAFFNMPHATGLRGFLMRAVGSSGGPKVTPIIKLFVVKDQAAFADQLRRLAALPGLARVIPAHGEIIERDAAAVVAQVAASLRG